MLPRNEACNEVKIRKGSKGPRTGLRRTHQEVHQVRPDPPAGSGLGRRWGYQHLGPSLDRSDDDEPFIPDPHAVSQAEAESYYFGLPSNPKLVYRTGAPWSPPRGPEAYRRRKYLREVFNHRLVNLWNKGLAWKVVEIMDTHGIRFTSLDIVRFQMVKFVNDPSDEEDSSVDGEEAVEVKKKKPAVSPVTIWVGVLPDITTASAAHDATQVILALLAENQITDVDVAFRESVYTRLAGPQLLSPVGDFNPLVDVISPLTPALGLHISTTARPNVQGTIGLYLAEGGEKNRLLGLTCNHVLSDSGQGTFNYVHHPSVPIRNVVLLGRKAHFKLVKSVKIKIAGHGISTEYWGGEIPGFVERENGNDPDDAANAAMGRTRAQALLDATEKALPALANLLNRVEKDWKPTGNRSLGRVLLAPAIKLGIGEERFTEDWGVVRLSRSKLGSGFRGNKIDLGTNLGVAEFTRKCFPRGDDNWHFEYPRGRLLQLDGIISDDLMHTPDMRDLDGEPRLLVVKNGNATNTTLGHANGAFSIVRDYSTNTGGHNTSMEWGIVSYDDKSGVFSEPGDSGAIIADIRGRIGGLLTSSAGK